MKRIFLLLLATALVFSLAGCSAGGFIRTAQVEKISAEAVKDMMDDPDTVIIDLRVESDWQESPLKIKGAIHEDPSKDTASWSGKYPKGKNLVLY